LGQAAGLLTLNKSYDKNDLESDPRCHRNKSFMKFIPETI